MQEQSQRQLQSPTTRGVHHLALCTDDMKATIDFYVEMLGMPISHSFLWLRCKGGGRRPVNNVWIGPLRSVTARVPVCRRQHRGIDRRYCERTLVSRTAAADAPRSSDIA